MQIFDLNEIYFKLWVLNETYKKKKKYKVYIKLFEIISFK